MTYTHTYIYSIIVKPDVLKQIDYYYPSVNRFLDLKNKYSHVYYNRSSDHSVRVHSCSRWPGDLFYSKLTARSCQNY